MKILNNLKRKFTLMRDDLEYIEKCISVLQEAKKKKKRKYNERNVTGVSNKTKAM